MALTTQSLSHSYGFCPLFQVSFSLEPHGSVQLMGPNGSGKSTLLRLLSGLIPPPKNTIFWHGKDILPQMAVYQNNIMLISHENGLLPHWTVFETVRTWQRLYGAQHQRIDHALEQLDLINEAHLPIEALSAGQRRRLALTRLALTDRPLWLLDEPMASLDDYSQHLLNVLVTQFCENGGMVIASSHKKLPWSDSQRLILSTPSFQEAA